MCKPCVFIFHFLMETFTCRSAKSYISTANFVSFDPYSLHLTRKESLVSVPSSLPKELATLELALSSNLPSLACPDIMFHTLATTGKEVHHTHHISSHIPSIIPRWPPCPQKPGFHLPPSTSSREWQPPPLFHLRTTHSPVIRYPGSS